MDDGGVHSLGKIINKTHPLFHLLITVKKKRKKDVAKQATSGGGVRWRCKPFVKHPPEVKKPASVVPLRPESREPSPVTESSNS